MWTAHDLCLKLIERISLVNCIVLSSSLDTISIYFSLTHSSCVQQCVEVTCIANIFSGCSDGYYCMQNKTKQTKKSSEYFHLFMPSGHVMQYAWCGWNSVQHVYRLCVACLLGCFSHSSCIVILWPEVVCWILMTVMGKQMLRVLHVHLLLLAP